jgi:fluoroquinolone resistance protein
VLAGLELDERLVDARDWTGRDAKGIRLTECRVDGVGLDEAALRGANVRDVIVSEGSWANADASEAFMKRVEFRNTRLTGVSFGNAKVEDVVFVECRLDLASFRFAKLAHVRFESCLMAEADFYDAGVRSTVFSGCSLAGASLAGVTFSDTELRGCDLTALGNAERLRGVRMPWADIAQSADVLAAGLGIEVVE